MGVALHVLQLSKTDLVEANVVCKLCHSGVSASVRCSNFYRVFLPLLACPSPSHRAQTGVAKDQDSVGPHFLDSAKHFAHRWTPRHGQKCCQRMLCWVASDWPLW